MYKQGIALHVNSPYLSKMVNVLIHIVHQLWTTYANNAMLITEQIKMVYAHFTTQTVVLLKTVVVNSVQQDIISKWQGHAKLSH